MRYSHIVLIALAFIVVSNSSAFARPMEQDTASPAEPNKVTLPTTDKKTAAKTSSRKSKRNASNDNPANGETIVFPKVSKVGKTSDDWDNNIGRRGSGNRQMFR